VVATFFFYYYPKVDVVSPMTDPDMSRCFVRKGAGDIVDFLMPDDRGVASYRYRWTSRRDAMMMMMIHSFLRSS
jgi:hypothetical protein